MPVAPWIVSPGEAPLSIHITRVPSWIKSWAQDGSELAPHSLSPGNLKFGWWGSEMENGPFPLPPPLPPAPLCSRHSRMLFPPRCNSRPFLQESPLLCEEVSQPLKHLPTCIPSCYQHAYLSPTSFPGPGGGGGWDSFPLTFIPPPLEHWPVSHEHCISSEAAHSLTGGHCRADTTKTPQPGKHGVHPQAGNLLWVVVTKTAGRREQRLSCARLVVPAGVHLENESGEC